MPWYLMISLSLFAEVVPTHSNTIDEVSSIHSSSTSRWDFTRTQHGKNSTWNPTRLFIPNRMTPPPSGSPTTPTLSQEFWSNSPTSSTSTHAIWSVSNAVTMDEDRNSVGVSYHGYVDRRIHVRSCTIDCTEHQVHRRYISTCRRSVINPPHGSFAPSNCQPNT